MQWISQFVTEYRQKLVFSPVAVPENLDVVLQLRFHLFALSNIDVHAREARPPALLIAFEATYTRQPALSARRVVNAEFCVPIGAGLVQLPDLVGHTIAILFNDALMPTFKIYPITFGKTVKIIIRGREIHLVTHEIKIPYSGRDDLLCQR